MKLPSISLPVAIAILVITGCRSETETSSRTVVNRPQRPQGEPEEKLKMVFRRYRNADFYFDRGRVDLMFRVDGKPETRTAPLSVSFRNGKLNVSAYSIRITHDSKRGLAWFHGATSQRWGDQVLVTSSMGRRPDLDQLLADSVLSAQLSAGGAGPPPQLEWLFSAEPMARLFAGTCQFTWGESKPIDGAWCDSVRVLDTSDQFTFWIDTASSLIRRIDLPSVVLPVSSPSGVLAEREIELTLRLENASFLPRDPPATADQISAELPRSPRWVRRLVPPPVEPPDWTSWQMSDLALVDADGRRIRRLVRPAEGGTAMILVGVPSVNDLTTMSGFLNRWSEQMPTDLHHAFALGIVFPSREDLRLANRSERAGRISLFARDADNQTQVKFSPTDVVVVAENAIQWMQPGLDDRSLPLLGSVLADLADGINVRQQVLDQAADARRQFRRAIQDELIRR